MMINFKQGNSLLSRTGKALNYNATAILAEVVFILLIMALVYWAGNLVNSAALTLSTMGVAWLLIWVFLRIRGRSWREFGLERPKSWIRTVVTALGGVILLHVLIGILLMPAVVDLTNQPLDIRRFDPIRGNLPALIGGLVIVWIVAAFFEEMVFRGYFLNRIADLFEKKSLGLAVGVFVSSLIFGAGHMYQGISGVILTGCVGIIYSLIYFFNQRNLWALVLTHGLYDTSAFLIIFFNLDRNLPTL